MSDDGHGETRREKPQRALRRGWTTGACATAAARAAWQALLTGEFPDPVTIRLPRGETPSFVLARQTITATDASASVIKDAGDDPDVTNGAEIIARVRRGTPGSGVTFIAGEGVGTVTRAGLPLAVGEPAINPVPRKMIGGAIADVSKAHHETGDAIVEISVANGAEIAKQTWNPRLGIIGGLSILGTTGIVVPFSCAAWIHSIHRGIDVARAAGLTHVAGATGNTSEAAIQSYYDLDEIALIDMGDFAGGMLKYLKTHPIGKITIAGGFAKLTKLAQGAMDLHSSRSEVDRGFLAELVAEGGGSAGLIEAVKSCNTAAEALAEASQEAIPLAQFIAQRAEGTARKILGDAPVSPNVVIFDRDGALLADSECEARE